MRVLRVSVQVAKTPTGSQWGHAVADRNFERAQRVGLDTFDFPQVDYMDATFRAWWGAVDQAEDPATWSEHLFILAQVDGASPIPLALRPVLAGTPFYQGQGTGRGLSPLVASSVACSLRLVAHSCQVGYEPMPWRDDVIEALYPLRTVSFDGPGALIVREAVKEQVDAMRAEEAARLPWVGTVTVTDPPAVAPRCAACGGTGRERVPPQSACRDWGPCRACQGRVAP
jgi:hypothetical protein